MKQYLTPFELRRKAFEILVRELGYADALRFLLQYERGSRDYTRDRHSFLPDLTPEQLLRESNKFLKRERNRRQPRKPRRSATRSTRRAPSRAKAH